VNEFENPGKMEARSRPGAKDRLSAEIPFRMSLVALDFVIASRVTCYFSSPMDYEAVIGLETHVQLKTKSKMWCGCANEFGAPPNTQSVRFAWASRRLPVANEEALRLTVPDRLPAQQRFSAYAKFDSEELFLSRYAEELPDYSVRATSAGNGYVDFEFEARLPAFASRAPIWKRMWARISFRAPKCVDFNRAGVPLMKIVSDPTNQRRHGLRNISNALKEICSTGGVSRL